MLYQACAQAFYLALWHLVQARAICGVRITLQTIEASLEPLPCLVAAETGY